MDFFTSQDNARRSTKMLVVYFICAVIGITLALYLVAWGALAAASDGPKPHIFQPALFLLICGVTLTIIALGSLYKTWELRRGGDYVAQMLGGRRIPPNTNDLAERRLLNIVEEMALASGIPAPPVYLLDNEKSINAFAAGFTPADAVIGVNRGTLDYLSRDELQGVIAHEFSHILNGDMRMNLRLIGILHGILLISIIGYYMMRVRSSSSSRDKSGNWLPLVGLGAYVIGSIGLLFGRLIKAAISRQREYLADASAVQFTRNPPGISGALKKIGGLADGSRIRHPEAETASHMFFSSAFGNFMSGMLSTHPPLTERIRRIDPTFTGKYGRTQQVDESEEAQTISLAAPVAARARDREAGQKIRMNPQRALESVGTLSANQLSMAAEIVGDLPVTLHEATREPFSARNVVFAMLLDNHGAVQQRQLEIIRQREGEPSAVESAHLRGLVQKAGVQSRLPTLEIVQGTLRSLSQPQYSRFRGTVQALVAADEKTSMFEFVLQRILLSHLDRNFLTSPAPAVKFHTWSGTIAEAASDLLAVIAHAGTRSESEAQQAYQVGVAAIQGGRAELLPRPRCTLNAVDAALSRMVSAAPQIKRRVLNALVLTAASDEQTTIEEAELLRAFADAMDCPLPPLQTAGK